MRHILIQKKKLIYVNIRDYIIFATSKAKKKKGIDTTCHDLNKFLNSCTYSFNIKVIIE